MSKPLNVFVLGANRGIGLQLVKDIMYNELLDLAGRNDKIKAIQLDSCDDSKYGDVAKKVESQVRDQGLNRINNYAGISDRPQSLESTTKEKLMKHINAILPLLLTKAFLPLLEAAATNSSTAEGINRAVDVNMSTQMGSTSDNNSGGFYAYRSSKTALNMLNKSLSVDMKKKNIKAVVLHHGWVVTDMGGPNAPIDTPKTVSGLLKVISGLKIGDSGKFNDYAAKELPW